MTFSLLLTPVVLLIVAIGASLVWAGCWMIWSDAAARRWPGMSRATRATIGLCSVLAGYHLAAYCLPDPWFPLKIPVERWFIVAGIVLIAVFASLGFDRRGRLSQDGNDTPEA